MRKCNFLDSNTYNVDLMDIYFVQEAGRLLGQKKKKSVVVAVSGN
jgi:hypothetical protein